MKRIIIIILIGIFLVGCVIAAFSVFYDEAVLTRKGTFYAGSGSDKLVALTFDDGPSLRWTPQILDALNRAGVKATFFMLGKHVEEFPVIARLVVTEGHEVANHSYSHHVLFYYTDSELIKEIKDTERAIKKVTGATTKYFRPPKAWINDREKKLISSLGYTTVLWSLNSKDWVTFDDKYMVKYLIEHIHPGDIILFHDSGGVFGTEGGDRKETVKVITRLVEKLRQMGYKFVTISQLLKEQGRRR